MKLKLRNGDGVIIMISLKDLTEMSKSDMNPIDIVADWMFFNSDDWTKDAEFAWIYGIIVGYTGEQVKELAEKFDWTDEQLRAIDRAFLRARVCRALYNGRRSASAIAYDKASEVVAEKPTREASVEAPAKITRRVAVTREELKKPPKNTPVKPKPVVATDPVEPKPVAKSEPTPESEKPQKSTEKPKPKGGMPMPTL
jgi:hypothetical protein